MNTDEIKALKKGDIIYECEYGLNVKVEITDEPQLDDEKIEFIGRNVHTGDLIEYLLTFQYAHYGPKLYKEPQYFSHAKVDGTEQSKVVFKIVGGPDEDFCRISL